MTSDNKIRQSGYDPDLKDTVLIDQASWDQIREAVLCGRPELQNNTLNRTQIFRTIANSLKVGAVFQQQ